MLRRVRYSLVEIANHDTESGRGDEGKIELHQEPLLILWNVKRYEDGSAAQVTHDQSLARSTHKTRFSSSMTVDRVHR